MSDNKESPPLTYTIDPSTSAKVVLKVSGAPLTDHGPTSLEIMPDEVHLLAWLFKDDNGMLIWRMNLVTVCGRWKTDQGDLSETRSDLTFVRPLNEHIDSTPEWLKTLCTTWLGQLNGLLTEKD